MGTLAAAMLGRASRQFSCRLLVEATHRLGVVPESGVSGGPHEHIHHQGGLVDRRSNGPRATQTLLRGVLPTEMFPAEQPSQAKAFDMDLLEALVLGRGQAGRL